jgi:hypothetical protein
VFLTETEIAAITGKTRKAAQRKALRELGYKFLSRPDGSPAVMRTAKPRQFDEQGAALLSDAQVAKRAASVVRTRAVYFLLQGSAVVYVGQTNNIHKRIGEHLTDSSKTFDAYHFIKVAESEAQMVEAAYIRKLRPKFNVQLNVNSDVEN